MVLGTWFLMNGKLKLANSFTQRWPVTFTLQLVLMYISRLKSVYTSKCGELNK